MERRELIQAASRLLLRERLAAHPFLDASLFGIEDDAQILRFKPQVVYEQA
jgi:hypothetical protein